MADSDTSTCGHVTNPAVTCENVPISTGGTDRGLINSAEQVPDAEEGGNWDSAALDLFGMAVDELTQFWQESGGGHAALALVQAQDELQAFAAACLLVAQLFRMNG